MPRNTLIGTPLSEVGDRLRALNESLKQSGMALSADTGVRVNYSRDGEKALSLVLEVYLFEKEEEKKND